jgi:hypothetical protein
LDDAFGGGEFRCLGNEGVPRSQFFRDRDALGNFSLVNAEFLSSFALRPLGVLRHSVVVILFDGETVVFPGKIYTLDVLFELDGLEFSDVEFVPVDDLDMEVLVGVVLDEFADGGQTALSGNELERVSLDYDWLELASAEYGVGELGDFRELATLPIVSLDDDLARVEKVRPGLHVSAFS